MSDNSELSERQKVKAIAQALRTTKIDKPGKVYVVAKKTKAGSSGSMIGSGKVQMKHKLVLNVSNAFVLFLG